MKISDKAHKHLSQDPIMKQLIDTYELPGWSYDKNLFLELVESIIGQQLSVKAADTITRRFKEAVGSETPTPEQILAIDDDTLRAAGNSYSKIKYIKGICVAVVNKEIDFESFRNMEDEEVITELIQLKGVGRWTAEMFLMFSFGREDVFSLGDLGLRNAVARLYNVDRDDLKAIEEISIQWKPYRSLASRYLWKSLDNTPKE
ncbi:MAG TPA: DNA-3-methyladenine glycosylase [Candidatus Levybacteria bacterium]|nr:DNA-3-methyladenine glycosylase [Candidatus Levybacteria bacterium]